MFPELKNYDLKKAGEIALYHLHCDLMPFEKLIETIESGLEVYSNAYFEVAKEANEAEDFISQSEFMMKGQIYNGRVIPMAYYSIVITLMSILEEGYNTMCRAYQSMNNYSLKYTDINGLGLERCILYLEKICNHRDVKKDMDWEYITVVRDIRNKIVHNGGRIKSTEKKLIKRFEKFSFGITEDGRIYVDSSNIKEMYVKALSHSERVFRIEPKEILD